jgi:hypothetical protein
MPAFSLLAICGSSQNTLLVLKYSNVSVQKFHPNLAPRFNPKQIITNKTDPEFCCHPDYLRGLRWCIRR